MEFREYGAFTDWVSEADALSTGGDREDINPFGKVFEWTSLAITFIPVVIFTMGEGVVRTVTGTRV